MGGFRRGFGGGDLKSTLAKNGISTGLGSTGYSGASSNANYSDANQAQGFRSFRNRMTGNQGFGNLGFNANKSFGNNQSYGFN